MDQPGLLEHQTVIATNGRVVAIGPAATTTVPAARSRHRWARPDAHAGPDRRPRAHAHRRRARLPRERHPHRAQHVGASPASPGCRRRSPPAASPVPRSTRFRPGSMPRRRRGPTPSSSTTPPAPTASSPCSRPPAGPRSRSTSAFPRRPSTPSWHRCAGASCALRGTSRRPSRSSTHSPRAWSRSSTTPATTAP